MTTITDLAENTLTHHNAYMVFTSKREALRERYNFYNLKRQERLDHKADLEALRANNESSEANKREIIGARYDSIKARIYPFSELSPQTISSLGIPNPEIYEGNWVMHLTTATELKGTLFLPAAKADMPSQDVPSPEPNPDPSPQELSAMTPRPAEGRFPHPTEPTAPFPYPKSREQHLANLAHIRKLIGRPKAGG